MISPTQFKSGIVIKVDDKLYSIISYQHVKPGKGPAYYRTKLKSVESDAIIEKTFRSEQKVKKAFLEEKKLTYLYKHDNLYHFMDQTTYEQLAINKSVCEDIIDYLKDGTEVIALTVDGKMIQVSLPNFIELKVKYTEPGFKGNTAKSTSGKMAILETGAKIQVPLFINEGDEVKLDTRTKEYVSKAK